MRSAIAISALLGAGAFALPSLQHRHLHDKRHDGHDTNHMDNAEVVEVVELYTVTITAGQPLPTPQEDAPIAAPQKLAVNPVPAPQKLAVNPVPQQPKSVTPPASSSTAPVVVPQPTSSTPAASSAPASAPVSSTPQDPNTFWATSPMSPTAGGSGAKDVLTQANYWRQQWKGLPAFTWSSELAKNAYLTATEPIYTTTNKEGKVEKHNQGGAMDMNHHLNPGSSSQCIASGNDGSVTLDLTPFEHAYLMWLCEMPTAGIQQACDRLPKPGKNPGKNPGTGHAQIIQGSVSKIGCYYMDAIIQKDPNNKGGLWNCDFA